MYPVSNDYLTAIRSHSRPYDTVYGTLTFVNPELDPLTIDETIMPADSISISKQCIDNEELMFGGVFLSTLKLSLMVVRNDLSRYDFFGAEIELFYKIQIGVAQDESPIFETIPLGKYVVSDADRPTNVVHLTAYDHMRLLDIDVGDNVLQGSAWDILSRISQETGYPLSFVEADLTSFVNYDVIIQLDGTRGVVTYRDAVKCVCQLLGCFAQDDRTGKLELRKFSSTVTASLSMSDWYAIIPADYKCNYVALSVTGLSGTYTAEDEEEEDVVGNLMVIDDAPAWDYGLEETLQGQTDDLFDYLKDIDYTPCEIDMPGDPSFDCGDRLSLTLNTGTIQTLITSYEWRFHNGTAITSAGTNPYLTGVSTQEFGQRILTQEVSDNKVQFYNFTNADDLEINDTETALLGYLRFVAVTKTSAMFIATILVDITVDDIEVDTEEEITVPVTAYDYEGNEYIFKDENDNPISFSGTTVVHHSYKRDGKCSVTIYYKMNEDIYPYMAIDNLSAGKHIITVEYPLTGLVPNIEYNWNIYINSSGGVINVDAESLRATIFGQGLSDAVIWDGKINITDDVTFFDIGTMAVSDMTDGVELIQGVNPDLYDPTHSYTVGDWCMRIEEGEEVVYQCIENTTGEWDSSKWEVYPYRLYSEHYTDNIQVQDLNTLTMMNTEDTASLLLRNVVYNIISEDGQYNISAEEKTQDDKFKYNITTEGNDE